MVAEHLGQPSSSRTFRNITFAIESATAQILTTLLHWRDRGLQRRALARLDDALLYDIGRSREEAARECAKPVWRA